MEAPSTSLPVPFVQEIAKEALTQVPERYVRPHSERPILSSTAPLPEIPVIDFSKLLSQDHNGPELDKLHYACKEWGFFQLINHDVKNEVVENVKRGVQEFFNLSIEEKKKFAQKPGDAEGYGQLFVTSEDQKLEWGDVFTMFTFPPEMRIKPHLFPKLPHPFRGDLDAYCEELRNVAIKILDLMAKSLAIDPIEIRELFGAANQSMRLNYYPACPQPELVIGLNPHSDGGGLTILLQANEVEGLQIKKDGLWIHVKPLPNAFIINLGDMMEVISNGIFKSIEHRATVNSEKERLSIATFYNPAINEVLRPAPSLVTPNTPPMFKPISGREYLKLYLQQELRGKSLLDTIRIHAQNGKSS